MNIDKTVIFTVDGTNIKVSDLNGDLRRQFELYDAYRQEFLNVQIKHEMANTAVQVKHLQLQEIIRKSMLTPSADTVPEKVE